ncbi:MAG: hypothetical protein K6E38_08110 [Fretibacterium sp.]|nr:hypothetical protein [Fretibacterium sp.]
MSEKEYFCTLTPVGEYFLGGERTFAFGENEAGNSKKTDYFIESENIPSQATVFGTLRFLMLKKAGLLSDGYADESRREKQAALVGAEGFAVGCGERTYGSLHSLGPVFLLHGEKRLVRAPMNHRLPTKEERQAAEKAGRTPCYEPFVMKPQAGRTDLGAEALLPERYDAKEGLFSGFLCLDDATSPLTADWDIFAGQEHTRIAKWQDDDAFFKKVCKHFTDSAIRFAFYCTAEEGTLPDEETVYLGQDKSTFRFTCREADPETTGTMETLRAQLEKLPGTSGASVFYALSDTYMDIDEAAGDILAYAVVQKRPFRTMETLRGAANFRDSRRKSALYQMVRAGSVFYVRPGKEEAFAALVKNTAMERVGFNSVQQLGGK